VSAAPIIARIAALLVRSLVALQPRAFRDQFGDAVIAETEAEIFAAVPSGTIATLSAGATAVTDAAAGMLLERGAQLNLLRTTMFNALVADVRQAVRALRRDAAFTAVALSTLGAGLAMCVIVAVLVNAYLWRSLPYPDSARLYDVQYATPAGTFPTGLDKVDWSPLTDVVEVTIGWDLDNFSLRGGAMPEAVQGTWVTPGYMEGFGVRPAIGRAFDADDYQAGQPMVAIISHRLWQSRFNSDPAIVGRTFESYVNDRPNEVEMFRIVGVLPANHWHLHAFTEILAPLRVPGTPYIVRLREGVPPALAAERITAVVGAAAANVPEGWSARLRSTHDSYIEQIKPLLLSVASATALVLLIACANVSVLLTVRATRRQRDNAVRQALGASAAQVTRATVAEPLLLGAGAVVLGLALAWGTLAIVAPMAGRYLGRGAPGGLHALEINPLAVAISFAVGTIVVVICSLVPTWIARRTPAGLAVSSAQKGATDGPSPQRARAVLIVVEVAACLTLLAGAGLTIQSAVRMLQVDMGLHTDNVIVGRYSLRPRAFADAAARAAFHERVLGRAAGLAGIERVGFTTAWPLQQAMMRDVAAAGGGRTRSGVVGMSPDYFQVVRIPMHAGRGFGAADRLGAPAVTIVSRTLAARLWPQGDAIGQTLTVLPPPGATTPPSVLTVVGIAGDVRHTHSDDDLADLYVPLSQTPLASVFVYLRTNGDAPAAEREFQRLLTAIDGEVAFAAARPLGDILDQQRAGAKLLASLLVVFAIVAAALALLGIYGVIAYAVKQREREIAVRIAIGADRATITRLFVREGALLLVSGLGLGIAGAVALGRLLRSQLFNVAAADPFVIGMVTCAFAICGLAAVAFPARAAASLDPAAILKE
jgi:putative ABC transport system permease protein